MRLLTGIIALVVTSTLAAADTRSLDDAAVRIAPKGAPIAHGSGVHIGGGYVLTAAHVATPSKANVVWLNKEYDVALIRVPGIESQPKRAMSCEPTKVGDHITVSGWPGVLPLATMSGIVSSGVINDMKNMRWKSFVLSDFPGVEGMSGSGVLDANGDVVGIFVGTFGPTFLLPANKSKGFPETPMHMPALRGFVPSTVVCNLLHNNGVVR